MDSMSQPPPIFLLAKLARERDALRECVGALDRAVTDCQKAKRECLEMLAEVDAILGAAMPQARAGRLPQQRS